MLFTMTLQFFCFFGHSAHKKVRLRNEETQVAAGHGDYAEESRSVEALLKLSADGGYAASLGGLGHLLCETGRGTRLLT